jgi:hypothetical protein
MATNNPYNYAVSNQNQKATGPYSNQPTQQPAKLGASALGTGGDRGPTKLPGQKPLSPGNQQFLDALNQRPPTQGPQVPQYNFGGSPPPPNFGFQNSGVFDFSRYQGEQNKEFRNNMEDYIERAAVPAQLGLNKYQLESQNSQWDRQFGWQGLMDQFNMGRANRQDDLSEDAFRQAGDQFNRQFDLNDYATREQLNQSNNAYLEGQRQYNQNFNRGIIESDRTFNQNVFEGNRQFGLTDYATREGLEQSKYKNQEDVRLRGLELGNQRYGIDQQLKGQQLNYASQERMNAADNLAQRYGIDRQEAMNILDNQTQRYGIDQGLKGQQLNYASQERMNSQDNQTQRAGFTSQEKMNAADNLMQRYGIDAQTAMNLVNNQTQRAGQNIQRELGMGGLANDQFRNQTDRTNMQNQYQLGLGNQAVDRRGQDIQRDLGMGNIDLQRQLGLGGQAVDRRGQDIQRQLGLGGQAVDRRGQDIQRELGMANVGNDQFRNTTDRMNVTGQLGIQQQAQNLANMVQLGQLDINQAQQMLAELKQGQEYGLDTRRVGLEEQRYQTDTQFQRKQLAQQAALERERMQNNLQLANVQAYGRNTGPNTQWMRSFA